jgi:hypothetical protein
MRSRVLSWWSPIPPPHNGILAIAPHKCVLRATLRGHYQIRIPWLLPLGTCVRLSG